MWIENHSNTAPYLTITRLTVHFLCQEYPTSLHQNYQTVWTFRFLAVCTWLGWADIKQTVVDKTVGRNDSTVWPALSALAVTCLFEQTRCFKRLNVSVRTAEYFTTDAALQFQSCYCNHLSRYQGHSGPWAVPCYDHSFCATCNLSINYIHNFYTEYYWH